MLTQKRGEGEDTDWEEVENVDPAQVLDYSDDGEDSEPGNEGSEEESDE